MEYTNNLGHQENSGYQEEYENAYNEQEGTGLHPVFGLCINAVGSPNIKRRGEASEASFVARACGFDFEVAKPWGENDAYDALVGSGPPFWRVQVKSTAAFRGGRYTVHACGDKRRYTKDHIDFLAVHIVPENVWYIVPIEACAGKLALHFYPASPSSHGKYEKYREAWCLLACSEPSPGRNDIPALCRCRELPVRCAVCPLK